MIASRGNYNEISNCLSLVELIKYFDEIYDIATSKVKVIQDLLQTCNVFYIDDNHEEHHIIIESVEPEKKFMTESGVAFDIYKNKSSSFRYVFCGNLEPDQTGMDDNVTDSIISNPFVEYVKLNPISSATAPSTPPQVVSAAAPPQVVSAAAPLEPLAPLTPPQLDSTT
jgi:hypothetical protein